MFTKTLKISLIFFILALAVFATLRQIKTTKAATEAVGLIRQDCTGYSNCYTSLSAWEAAYGGISFGSCSQGDLVCADKIAVAQIDGTWTSADTAAVTIDGWTTGPQNYIRIYTTSTARHDGKWDTGKYRIEVSTSNPVIYILEDYVRIEGLQVYATDSIYDRPAYYSGGGELRVSYNIFRGTNHYYGFQLVPAGGAVMKFWNNIIYDCRYGIAYGYGNLATVIAYNNTIRDSSLNNFELVGSNLTLYLKNNIAQGAGDNDYRVFYATVTSSNNISEDTSSPNVSYRSKAVIFVDKTNNDFHLSPSDTNAKDAGVNLSGDTNLSFSDDIDSTTRSGSWDIGADEYSGTTPSPYCGDGSCNGTETCSTCSQDCGACPPSDTTPPVRSNSSPAGTLSAGTTSTTLSLTTNENATCKYSAASGVSYSSMANTFSTTGGTSHSTTVSGLSNGITYNYYVRCQDTAGNANTNDYTITFSVATPSTPDTTAPATITNLTVSSCTANSCTLSWTAPGDDGSTGTAASYDIRYSIATITESNWNSANQVSGEPSPQSAGTSQSMTVSGLSSNATYYFAIKTSDEVPNMSGLSNVASGTTSAASTFNYVIDNFSAYPIPTIAKPAKGASIQDPNFHTTVTRITDKTIDGYTGSSITNEYATSDIENSDGTYIVLNTGSGQLYNANTFQRIKQLNINAWSGAPEMRWSATQPNILYYRDGTSFYSYNVETDANTLIRNFKNDFPSATAVQNDDEGEPSKDKRYWAFLVKNGDAIIDIFTYDLQENRILGKLSEHETVGYANSVHISTFGDRVVTDGGSWNLDFTNKVNIQAGNTHWDVGVDANGNEVAVVYNGDEWMMQNIKTGAKTVLKSVPWGAPDFKPGWDGCHVSANNIDKPGWALISCYSTPSEQQNSLYWLTNTLFMIELKANARVWRVVHTHSIYVDYFSQAFATINTKGTKIYWGSNWDNTGGQIETYQLTLPSTWYEDLSGGVTPPPADTTAPSIPTNLTATTVSSSQINLSWTASTDNIGVTGYRVYRCQGTGCTPSTQIVTSAANSYSNTGLSPSTIYVYRVAAYDAAGNVSGQSSSASATTQAPLDTTPPIISSVSAVNITSNSATITWITDEPATSQVEYGTTTTYGSQTTLDSNLVTSHSVAPTGLSASTTYHYRVKSKDSSNNERVSSDYVFITLATPPLTDTTPPSAITNLSASNISQTSIDLSWTSPGDDGNSGTASLYDIRYSTSPITESNWSSAAQVTGEPSPLVAGTSQVYTLTGLSPNATYYFALKTRDEVPNWSGLSNIVSATTQSNICTSFIYYSWSACQPNNTQSRTVISSLPQGCTGGNPVLSQSCVYTPPTCTSFTYSNWNECQPNNIQTRTIISQSPQGCTGGNPILSQSCTYIPSSPVVCTSFTYSSWSACQPNNIQTRTIVSQSPQGCDGGNPVLSQSCAYTSPTCTSFTYSNWSACQSNNTQSRTVSEQSPLGCTGGNPVLSQSCAYTPPSSDGGGGGGGLFEDITPPPQPKEFKAQGADKQITLTWQNPKDDDFVRILIIRKEESQPISRTDGKVIYEGTAQEFTDTNLDNTKTYYYAIYSYDRKPNYSQPVLIFAKPKEGFTQIALPTPTPEIALEKPLSQMTTSELQAKIAEIVSAIKQLQAKLEEIKGGGISEIPATYRFAKTLQYGQISEDVKYLQTFLKSQGTEIYPEGLVTSYFGPKTKSAVIKFQEKYAQEILSPWKLTKGTGIVGKTTIEKINQILGR